MIIRINKRLIEESLIQLKNIHLGKIDKADYDNSSKINDVVNKGKIMKTTSDLSKEGIANTQQGTLESMNYTKNQPSSMASESLGLS